jgi:hypothetical protein
MISQDLSRNFPRIPNISEVAGRSYTSLFAIKQGHHISTRDGMGYGMDS